MPLSPKHLLPQPRQPKMPLLLTLGPKQRQLLLPKPKLLH